MSSQVFYFSNPSFNTLGYVIAVANLKEKHDRSAPSDYHWKILKCRMLIFSNSSILSCPDDKDVKQIHIIFSKVGDDYDKLISLFMKLSLVQLGEIRSVNDCIYTICMQYTVLAKIAPIWNSIEYKYLINNRKFLTASGPQDGMQYNISCTEDKTRLSLKAIRLTFIKPTHDVSVGEYVRVLPSLNKAMVEDTFDKLPENNTSFNSYKDLRRHWKNIHGYRLPEEESSYYSVRFWRGEPLTYPKCCIAPKMPIIVPIPKQDETIIIARFINHLEKKMAFILREPIKIWQLNSEVACTSSSHIAKGNLHDTQAISLCTPTQNNKK